MLHLGELHRSFPLGRRAAVLSVTAVSSRQSAPVPGLVSRRRHMWFSSALRLVSTLTGTYPGLSITHPTDYPIRPDTDRQVKNQSGSVYVGYRTVLQADQAFAYAESRLWVASTRSRDPLVLPKPAHRISKDPPTTHAFSLGTPLSIGSCSPAWYVVYVGVRPGVYDNL